MSKTNKELAVDVALKVIESNQRMPYGPQNRDVLNPVKLIDICNIIENVYVTLENLDKHSSDK